jgi:hypothetical protein
MHVFLNSLPELSRADRFVREEGDITISPCVGCRHYPPGVPATCTAFPEGIAEAILKNEHDHRQRYPGDGGVLFEGEEE